MRAIILAAGRGARLESVFPGRPKCLVEFGGISLLQHQIRALAACGITDIVLVVGYEKQQIIDHVKDLPATFTFVENPIFAKTNTIYSLWLCKEYFNDDFIYFNADVLFDYKLVEKLVSGVPESLFACIRHECGEEEVKVICEGDRIVTIGKKIDPMACFGEFIGIAKFVKKVNTSFASILDNCIADQSLWVNFFEYAVNLLAQEHVLRCCDVSDFPAAEIDFPEDLENARKNVYPRILAGQYKG
jgi:choline kinase